MTKQKTDGHQHFSRDPMHRKRTRDDKAVFSSQNILVLSIKIKSTMASNDIAKVYLSRSLVTIDLI